MPLTSDRSSRGTVSPSENSSTPAMTSSKSERTSSAPASARRALQQASLSSAFEKLDSASR